MSLSGNLVTDGLFHISSGTAGALAAPTTNDELVIVSSDASTMGMAFLSTATTVCSISFSEPGGHRCYLNFDHNTDTYYVDINTAEMFKVNSSGAVFNEDGVADQDFRVEGDTNTNLFMCDAGLDAVGIGTAAVMVIVTN